MYEKILIIDDNKEILTALKVFLRNYFKEIITISSPVTLHEKLGQHDFTLVILDMNFKAGANIGNEGLFWLKEILKKDPNLPVICITAYGAINLAVEALKSGATDFIEKPWKEEQLLASIMRAAKLRNSQNTIKELRKKNRNLTSHQTQMPDFVKGSSLKMQNIWDTVEKVAPTDANILIFGENGTGKEIVARVIHKMSKRKDEAFIAIDLGSLVPTLFESELFGHKKGAFTDAKQDKTGWIQLADGGTVFLDEIANTEPTQQTKLLHVLQNKIITPVGSNEAIPVSTRFIAATNDDLLQRVQKGSFREDLLYRLNTITLTIPPLRERKEDIPELVDFYLKKYQHKYGKKISSLSSHTLERLKNYAWPGNIRELSHCIERAVILSQNGQPDFADFCIHTNSLHKNHDSKPTYNLQELEKDAVKKAIREAQGNYSKAAELLGISRKTLYNKISKYGL